MRLIDSDVLYGIESLLNTDIVQNSQEASWLMAQVLHDIQASPAIDPETLPIARQLREELAKVTAERDAAVSDLENIMAYNSGTCQSCKNNQCYVRGGTKPCLPKWRGPRKEANP